jgi:hypothetical protein
MRVVTDYQWRGRLAPYVVPTIRIVGKRIQRRGVHPRIFRLRQTSRWLIAPKWSRAAPVDMRPLDTLIEERPDVTDLPMLGPVLWSANVEGA